jgi:LmbE family N-acetylglucosaminyl deacetylase
MNTIDSYTHKILGNQSEYNAQIKALKQLKQRVDQFNDQDDLFTIIEQYRNDLKTIFKKTSLKLHPDHNTATNASEIYKMFKAAYELMNDIADKKIIVVGSATPSARQTQSPQSKASAAPAQANKANSTTNSNKSNSEPSVFCYDAMGNMDNDLSEKYSKACGIQ